MAEATAASSTMPAMQQDLGATAGTEKTLEPDQTMSSLAASGAIGSRQPKQITGLSSSMGSPLASRPNPGSARGNRSDMSKRIAEKYHHDVRVAEDHRRGVFVPLAEKGPLHAKPTPQDMMRDMKKELDGSLNKFGAHVVGRKDLGTTMTEWNRTFDEEGWQKKLQFLHEHSRTGHFVEMYGSDGRYEGDFLHGMRHGKGRHEFRGDVYDGEFKWDQRHGWGKLTMPDGVIINGEWQKGKEHGYITFVDPRGTVVYEGEFKNGKRDGLGRQIFDSGDMYDGGWIEGKLNDRGVYYFANGDKLYGMWKRGLYHGVGVFHYADGSVSRRTYQDGKLMSVQDYEHSSQRYGKTLHREDMTKNTKDQSFPKEIFMLNSV